MRSFEQRRKPKRITFDGVQIHYQQKCQILKGLNFNCTIEICDGKEKNK